MIYSDFVTAVSTLMVVPSSDANFVAILPRAIEYAELRLYRDLDLAQTSSRVTTFQFTAGNRNIAPSAGTFITVDSFNVITPAATSNPELGVRNQLTRVSWDWLDAVYGSNAAALQGLPQYWAFQDVQTLAVGPWPDATYHTEIIGEVRPAPLSVSNTSTILSLYFPDLMVCAAMIFLSSYQRDFGRSADDPSMAVSYESQYSTLIKGAAAEESRKKAGAS